MTTEPYVYERPQPWCAPKHARQFDADPDSPLYPHFFWSTWGEPMLKRTPPGSFPADRAYVERHSVDVAVPPVDPDSTLVEASWAPGDVPPLSLAMSDQLAEMIATRHVGPEYDEAVEQGRAIRCPDCRFVSFNPSDVRHGFCGNCHAFTTDSPGRSLGGSTRAHLQLVAGYDYVRDDA